MSRIIKVGEVNIRMREVSGVVVTCESCSYYRGEKCRCVEFKGPADKSFFNICRSNLVAANECPEPGELEKLNRDKATLTSEEAIKEYCNNYCLIDCQTNCPLYKFKNGTKNN
jgi:hypothetical protein